MDLYLAEDMDLFVQNGDFVFNESPAKQHQLLLLLAHPGDLKQYPERGVGIQSYLNDERENLSLEIRSEFERDGMNVRGIKLNGSSIEIDAR